ncbi:CRISPR type I-F/YPEST-associated protein Csy2 [Moraxella lacunata]|uniref:CRISPR type I-F/YPEST-associated protein Csy2 n=1 Tax=Moraxella lacunata TaxID=477 RepID=A0A378TT17_MORLA|nr:type I-F CRISPR-associated protein Csy2 [Moraxella lacunata]STZ63080.1 CRISPR type I-F/YPEST-associated protein Csy2 [Moraxella lacunata]
MSFIYPQHSLVGYVRLDRLKIINANAVSAPLTYGFPALTGFVGATHSLSRKVSSLMGFENIRLDGVLVACFDCQVQTYQEGYKDKTFAQTRNPILKSGKTAPIIEEGRCHLTISLLIGVYKDSVQDLTEDEANQLTQNVQEFALSQRWAGGSLTGMSGVHFVKKDDIDEQKSRLCPAFIITSAHDELGKITQELQEQNPNATALDALIETAVLHHTPPTDSQSEWTTHSVKKQRGWLVPMPVGFVGISDKYNKGQMSNARSDEYPAQFVEAVYSLGKWRFANRIDDLDSALWYGDYDDTCDLYVIKHSKYL